MRTPLFGHKDVRPEKSWSKIKMTLKTTFRLAYLRYVWINPFFGDQLCREMDANGPLPPWMVRREEVTAAELRRRAAESRERGPRSGGLGGRSGAQRPACGAQRAFRCPTTIWSTSHGKAERNKAKNRERSVKNRERIAKKSVKLYERFRKFSSPHGHRRVGSRTAFGGVWCP